LASALTPSGDCNDASEDVNPGAAEAAGDGVDQDCNGVELCFADVDRDGFRTLLTLSSPRVDCSGLGEALATAPSVDCDDASAQRYPGAVETCNLLDDDCDGTVDDGVATLTYYPDADRDSFGDASSPGVASCLPVATYVLNAADCDDTTSAVRPGVSEVAGDGLDQNCDGLEFCYTDADDDGYRPNSSSVVISANASCSDSGEAVAGDPVGDCNDLVAAIFPLAIELVADGVDQNCDSVELCYADADGDGYRPNATATVVSSNLVCTDPGERSGSAPTTDCNDLQAAIYPGATEVISDGIDQDCNGRADDGIDCPDCIAATRLGRNYALCARPRTYADAQLACQAIGLDLAVPGSAGENTFLLGLLPSGWTATSWFGLNDLAVEGTFRTVAGALPPYSAWARGEPNNYNGNEDCAQMTTGGWNDLTCSDLLSALCEQP
jgi:hypothetical protein